MNTRFGHLQINVQEGNVAFYKGLFAFLEWPVVYEGDGMLGVGGKSGDSLWFTPATKSAKNDYDGLGVNHIAIAASSQGEVDEAAGYLKNNNIAALFGTPCHRPDFASSESETYYQVMFESPDGVLFEIVYTGPKS
jgi:catechol 2,3-dioxygenase-like lactoylglutathione lyase family enzyme